MTTRTARSLALALAGSVAIIVAPNVLAQAQRADSGASLPQVQVQAKGTVVERAPIEGQPLPVGKEGAAGTFELVTMTRGVNLADLNLSTPEGVQTLHKRIDATARSECNELRVLAGPLTTQAKGYEHVNDNCVKDAVAAARKQADLVVASAKEKRHPG